MQLCAEDPPGAFPGLPKWAKQARHAESVEGSIELPIPVAYVVDRALHLVSRVRCPGLLEENGLPDLFKIAPESSPISSDHTLLHIKKQLVYFFGHSHCRHHGDSAEDGRQKSKTERKRPEPRPIGMPLGRLCSRLRQLRKRQKCQTTRGSLRPAEKCWRWVSPSSRVHQQDLEHRVRVKAAAVETISSAFLWNRQQAPAVLATFPVAAQTSE